MKSSNEAVLRKLMQLLWTITSSADASDAIASVGESNDSNIDQDIANFDLARSLAPKNHRHQIPITPPQANPASSDVPGPIPRFTYSGWANMTEPAPRVDRMQSLAAKRLAAYCGYESGRYIKMHWKSTKPPVQNVVMPMTEAMKGKSVRDVQAKMKRPIGKPVEAKMAGTRRCSCARGPFLRRSGF